MSAYTGWVNEILDQYKHIFKGVNKLLKENHTYTPAQFALIDLNQRLLRLGTNSVKFKLPLDAMLFDVDPDTSVLDTIQTFIGDKLNLPFKEIALEFLIEYENGVQSPFVIFAEQVEDEIELLVFNRKKNDWNSIRGLHISVNRLDYSVMVQLRDGDQIRHIGPDDLELKQQVETITQIAISSIMQFLCALNCSNVNISDDDIKPSTVKQTMRKSKGKLPLFTYKVLTVQIGKSSTETIKLDANQTQDEEFIPSGKRAHIRRGHPRKYKSGLKIWVNACSVGNKKLGQIEKSYKLKKVIHHQQPAIKKNSGLFFNTCP